MTKEQLLTKIDLKVYENDNHEVTAESLNELLKDIVGESYGRVELNNYIPSGYNVQQESLDAIGLNTEVIEGIFSGTITNVIIDGEINIVSHAVEGVMFMLLKIYYDDEEVVIYGTHLRKSGNYWNISQVDWYNGIREVAYSNIDEYASRIFKRPADYIINYNDTLCYYNGGTQNGRTYVGRVIYEENDTCRIETRTISVTPHGYDYSIDTIVLPTR